MPYDNPKYNRPAAEVAPALGKPVPYGTRGQGYARSTPGNFGSGGRGQRDKSKGDGLQSSGNFGSGTYQPKKPVKSFMDLEIYQQALAASVAVANSLNKKEKNKKNKELTEAESLIWHNMLPCALGLPHLIAEAHSYRFGTGQDCIILLEKTMVNCNKMMVYLEQVRDICQTGLEHDFFEELIKKYLYIRRKTLNLQRVWKKYIEHPDGNFGSFDKKQPPNI